MDHEDGLLSGMSPYFVYVSVKVCMLYCARLHNGGFIAIKIIQYGIYTHNDCTRVSRRYVA